MFFFGGGCFFLFSDFLPFSIPGSNARKFTETLNTPCCISAKFPGKKEGSLDGVGSLDAKIHGRAQCIFDA